LLVVRVLLSVGLHSVVDHTKKQMLCLLCSVEVESPQGKRGNEEPHALSLLLVLQGSHSALGGEGVSAS
jgi:hypothetical protein